MDRNVSQAVGDYDLGQVAVFGSSGTPINITNQVKEINIYQDIEQEHEVWENCTKFGCEHRLPLYDEETNPYGVYLYLNDYTLKDVFPNTHLVVQ